MKPSLEVADLLRTIRDSPISEFKKGCAVGHLMLQIQHILDMGMGPVAFQMIFPSVRDGIIDLVRTNKNTDNIDELIAIQEGIITGRIVVEP